MDLLKDNLHHFILPIMLKKNIHHFIVQNMVVHVTVQNIILTKFVNLFFCCFLFLLFFKNVFTSFRFQLLFSNLFLLNPSVSLQASMVMYFFILKPSTNQLSLPVFLGMSVCIFILSTFCFISFDKKHWMAAAF